VNLSEIYGKGSLYVIMMISITNQIDVLCFLWSFYYSGSKREVNGESIIARLGVILLGVIQILEQLCSANSLISTCTRVSETLAGEINNSTFKRGIVRMVGQITTNSESAIFSLRSAIKYFAVGHHQNYFILFRITISQCIWCAPFTT